MSLDTDKIKKPKKKNTTTIKEGPDGKLYTAEGLLVSAGEGMGMLSEKERMMIKSAIDKMGKTENKSGPDLTKRAKGGMINKYAKGGSVNKNKKNMITTKGWGASRKT
jgi:hypothetical protein